jgi:PAS domain S-box-containing protein
MPSERSAPTTQRSIALEQQAAFLKAVAERGGSSAIVGKDLSGRVVSWSEQASALYGYDAREILGQNALILQGAQTPSERGSMLYAHVVATGKWEGRVRRYRKDGSSFPAHVTLLLRRDPAGKPCGLVAVSRDLSEAERIERELSESRAREAQMLDSKSDLLLVTDFAGKVWDVNPLTCGATGRTRGAWLGFELQGKFADPAQAEALLRQTLLQDEVHDQELALLNARGESFRVRCDSLALPGKNGKLDRVLIAMRPLQSLPPISRRGCEPSEVPSAPASMPGIASTRRSHRPRAEHADQTQRSASAPPSSKSSPVLELSHELRTPLNAIIGFAELLRDGKVGPVATAHQEYLDDILTSARHMQRLLNEGLSLPTIPVPRPAQSETQLELSALALEVRDGLKLVATSKSIDVRFELEPALWLPAEHATKVRQILYNYLSNALKFSSEGGIIWLRCFRLDQQNLRIEVEDTGPGIAPEDQARLFREFEQLEISGELRQLGTGLGLSISKRLAEGLGGSVSVESALGRGSVFSAVIPSPALGAMNLTSDSERFTPESATRLVAAATDDGGLSENEVCCA